MSLASNTPARNPQTMDALNRLETLIAQACSLSSILYGEGGGAFRSFNETIQDNVLWLLSDLLHEAEKQIPLATYLGAHHE